MRCRDEVFVAADPGLVYQVLADLRTYEHWWTLMRAVPLGEPELRPGARFRFEGGRDGTPTTSWTVEVRAAVPAERIELAYVEGDLLGEVAWELRPAAGGTTAAYVYRGVRANSPSSAATFERYGTSLHSLAMELDALAGLARYAAGNPPDEHWHEHVRASVAAGIASLEESGPAS